MRRLACTGLVVTCVLGCSLAALAKVPEAIEAKSATGVIGALGRSYEARDPGSLDRLLTDDFRFHFSPGDLAGNRYAEGMSREFEMRSARHMFHGADTAGAMPRPDSIAFLLGGLEEGADPEHPDSTCHYRLVVASGTGLRLVLPGGEVAQTRGMQVFHVVRGDAAARGAGLHADTTRWYLRRWIEDLDEVTATLAALDGECGADTTAAGTLPAMPIRLAVRPVGAPLCATLKLLCDLPAGGAARVEVYDVAGRRVSERALPAHAVGTVAIEAGNGMRFKPGAYWVRLSQAGRPSATRMVMVAR